MVVTEGLEEFANSFAVYILLKTESPDSLANVSSTLRIGINFPHYILIQWLEINTNSNVL